MQNVGVWLVDGGCYPEAVAMGATAYESSDALYGYELLAIPVSLMDPSSGRSALSTLNPTWIHHPSLCMAGVCGRSPTTDTLSLLASR